MGLFRNKSKKLDTKKTIALEEAKRYEKDKRYADYIFPAEIQNGKLVCRPMLKKQAIEEIKDINKKRKNSEFDNYVRAKWTKECSPKNSARRKEYENKYRMVK